MLTDPLMDWGEEEGFPYKEMSSAGISPSSGMRAVKDAQFQMVEQGLWGHRKRKAWDRLRFPDRRLLVDLLMYSVTVEEIQSAVREVFALPDPDYPCDWEVPDPAQLARMNEEVQPFAAMDLAMDRISEYDWQPDLEAGPDFNNGGDCEWK